MASTLYPPTAHYTRLPTTSHHSTLEIPPPPPSPPSPPAPTITTTEATDPFADPPSTSFSATSSTHVHTLAYPFSPYSHPSTSATSLLALFLSHTRGTPLLPRLKRCQLHVHLRLSAHPSRSAPDRHLTFHLDLPTLTDSQARPFAVAADQPARRGSVPLGLADAVRSALRAFLRSLRGSTASTLPPAPSQDYLHPPAPDDDTRHLQVLDPSTGLPSPASSAAITASHLARQHGRVPWLPLSAPASPPPTPAPTPAPTADLSFTTGDFDLSSLFLPPSQRRQQRAASLPAPAAQLYDAIEHFADDRHLSKWLLLRDELCGWDWPRVALSLRTLILALLPAEPHAAAAAPSLTVRLSLPASRVRAIHLVWTPVRLAAHALHGRTAHRLLVLCGLLLLVSLPLHPPATPLLVAVAALVGWCALLYLVHTSNSTVYDTVGTVWTLAPLWVPLPDVEPGWDEARVRQTLQRQAYGEDYEPVLQKRAERWGVVLGCEQDAWVQSQKERIRFELQRQL